MTLNEAIEHCKGKSKGDCGCAKEHEQLSQWLIDYKKIKERATPKKPIKNKMRHEKTSSLDKFFGLKDTYTCPNCGNALLEHYMNERQVLGLWTSIRLEG